MEAVTCIGEAVIGTAAQGVLHVTGRAFKFKSILKHLETTIVSANSTINEIYHLDQDPENALMDELHMLIQELIKAKQLVGKCSKISWWNYKKYRYSKKLLELDGSLCSLQIQMDSQIKNFKNVQRILGEIGALNRRLDQMVPEQSNESNVFLVGSGLRRIVQSMPRQIILYLSSLERF
nr:uncharacterized protein LOC112040537 [Quercus suber]POE89726.1 hypothetical protein CFP56_49498 [Quercus suber]